MIQPTVFLLCLLALSAVQDPGRELRLPLEAEPVSLDLCAKMDGVQAARLEGMDLVLMVDPFVPISLADLEERLGVEVDRSRLRLEGTTHLVLSAPAGGGGSAPCLESAEHGCFSADPITQAIAGVQGVAGSLLIDMRPGGELGWQVIGTQEAPTAASVLEAALDAGHPVAYRDFVLSGVATEEQALIPSEYLPRGRPGAPTPGLARVDWARSLPAAIERAIPLDRMILLSVHHFD